VSAIYSVSGQAGLPLKLRKSAGLIYVYHWSGLLQYAIRLRNMAQLDLAQYAIRLRKMAQLGLGQYAIRLRKMAQLGLAQRVVTQLGLARRVG
jgi:hypothetical protein